MFDDKLRRLKDRLLGILDRGWIKYLTPNQVTSAAFGVGLGIPVFLYLGYNRTAFGLWIVNRILDGLDGLVARKREMVSDFGGYYDILTDFIIYGSVPLAIALREDSLSVYIAALLLITVFYINGASWMFLSGIMEKRKRRGVDESLPITTLEMPRGLIEGGETILFYSLFMLIPDAVVYLMLGMAALTAAGIIIRFLYARKSI
ncbi:MAG: CDP-alcohol phosphatidyltransferase family protein [Spirochaetales bacterium]|nr:CDP-alcohol phosphatidyltransferase family protein [Spirochaetales bacterium]